MKVGTQMDPNDTRRGNRAFRFNPNLGIVPVGPNDPEEEGEENVITQEELEDSTKVPPNLEPEPDDPDAA